MLSKCNSYYISVMIIITSLALVLPAVGATLSGKDFNPGLEYPDVAVQQQVMTVLASLDSEDATDILIQRLKQYHEPILAELLAERGDQRAVLPLIESFNASPGADSFRIAAMQALGLLQDSAAIDLIGSRLTDNNPEVSLAALEAITEIGPIANKKLLKNYKMGSSIWRGPYLQAMGGTCDPTIIDILLKDLKDPDPGMRAGAAYGLGYFAEPRIFEALTSALQDTNENVRFRAIIALGNTWDTRAVPILIGASKNDPSKRVMAKALYVWEQYHDIDAKNRIFDMADTSFDPIFSQLLSSVAKINDPRSLPILRKKLEENTLIYQYGAVIGLDKLRDNGSVSKISSFINVAKLDRNTQRLRSAAITALGNIGDRKGTDSLLEALGNEKNVAEQVLIITGQ